MILKAGSVIPQALKKIIIWNKGESRLILVFWLVNDSYHWSYMFLSKVLGPICLFQKSNWDEVHNDYYYDILQTTRREVNLQGGSVLCKSLIKINGQKRNCNERWFFDLSTIATTDLKYFWQSSLVQLLHFTNHPDTRCKMFINIIYFIQRAGSRILKEVLLSLRYWRK